MEDQITLHSQAKNFASSDDIVLDDTTRTQIIFRAGIHDEGIRGDLIRYRKGVDGKCEELTSVNFNSLHENDSIKIYPDFHFRVVRSGSDLYRNSSGRQECRTGNHRRYG